MMVSTIQCSDHLPQVEASVLVDTLISGCRVFCLVYFGCHNLDILFNFLSLPCFILPVTLPRKDSFFDTRSFNGDVGADIVLLPGLAVISEPVWERELGIVGGSRGEVTPLLSPLWYL